MRHVDGYPCDRWSSSGVSWDITSSMAKYTRPGVSLAAFGSAEDGSARDDCRHRHLRGADRGPLPPLLQVGNVLTRRHQGSGMGLFITKALVERHGGSLRIESHPREGTTIRVTLPIERLLPAEGLLAAAIVSHSPQQQG